MEKSIEKILIQKYLSGQSTEEEKAIIETWYLETKDEGESPDQMMLEKAEEKIWNKLSIHRNTIRHRIHWFLAVASIIACIGLGLYFNKSKTEIQADIQPGKNSATLTLSNGRKIILSENTKANLAEEVGINIKITTDGQLIYDIQDHLEDKTVRPKVNILTTNRGEKFQIHLPDGTKVWLNAKSSLKYPTTFNKQITRRVSVSGEAYFEVAKDEKHPFIVESKDQNVEVLGTHFNISSYADDPISTTTLLEGSVKVNKTELKPNQQSVLKDHKIKVVPADIEKTMAWKNGDFIFRGEDLKTTMRKIERWYNVDITYATNVTENIELGGWVSRKSNLSEVLRRIELIGNVHFKVEGRKIIVTK